MLKLEFIYYETVKNNVLDISVTLFIQRTSKLYKIGKYHQITVLKVLKRDLEIVSQQLRTIFFENYCSSPN